MRIRSTSEKHPAFITCFFFPAKTQAKKLLRPTNLAHPASTSEWSALTKKSYGLKKNMKIPAICLMKIPGWLVSVPCWCLGNYSKAMWQLFKSNSVCSLATKEADNGLFVIKSGWFQLVDVLNKWPLWSLFRSFESCILRSLYRELWCNPLWNATSLSSWDSKSTETQIVVVRSLFYPLLKNGDVF